MEDQCDLLGIEQQRCVATPAKDLLGPDLFNNSDVKLLDDEEFNFDIPLSPTKTDKQRPSVSPVTDDDEIFFGPVGFREQVAAKVADDVEKEVRPLSPLTEKQQVELFVEAHKVAILIKEESKKLAASLKSSPAKQNVPEISVASSPVREKRKPGGPFSLDFDSPIMEEEEEEVPKKKVCGELLGLEDSSKENTGSQLQRSRSMRMPGTRYSGSSGLPQRGSGLKPPGKKRVRTSSESSPVQLDTSPNTSTISASPTKKSRLSIQPRRLQKTKSPLEPVEPRRSPRLSVPSKQRLTLKYPAEVPNSTLQLKKPSGLQPPQTKTVPAAKPSMLKGPIKKLELIKPRKLQAPRPKPGSGIPSVGPLKAGPLKGNMDKSLNTSTKVSPLATSQPLRPVQSHLMTPVKKDRVIAPKNLMSATESAQLVTPKKSLFRGSSVSSAGSLESPAPLPQGTSPAVGISSRSRVVHTPLMKDPLAPIVAPRQPSGWTPVRRARPMALEDEYIVCTKRLKE